MKVIIFDLSVRETGDCRSAISIAISIIAAGENFSFFVLPCCKVVLTLQFELLYCCRVRRKHLIIKHLI